MGSNNQLFLNYKDDTGGRLRLLVNEAFKQRILEQFDSHVGLMRMSDCCLFVSASGYYLDPEEEREFLHKKYDFCVCHIAWVEGE
ncbi:MAG: hypothetical protein F6K11_07625 [Leptolyngbya sp. SIO3F4]|nr:hypothetical protein [Leptolyngbya sp. SIO3F4]